MSYRSLTCRIRGVAPLLMHNGRLADPRDSLARELKKLSEKRAKTDADHAEMSRVEWFSSLYLHEGRPCLPNEMIEAMLVNAAKQNRRGPAAKAGILCEHHFPLCYDGPRDPQALWGDERFRLRVGVRVQDRRVMRTRPIFRQWEAQLEIQYLDEVLNKGDVQRLLEKGGMLIGLGDWRPKFGRFEIIP